MEEIDREDRIAPAIVRPTTAIDPGTVPGIIIGTTATGTAIGIAPGAIVGQTIPSMPRSA